MRDMVREILPNTYPQRFAILLEYIKLKDIFGGAFLTHDDGELDSWQAGRP